MTERLQASCFRFATLILLLASSVTLAEETAPNDGQRFVAIGQLAKVRSGSGSDARFVLLDEQGKVISSLRPAAGVALDLSLIHI